MSSTVPVSLYLLHVRTTSLWFTPRRLDTALVESPSWHKVTMRTRLNCGMDRLGMVELQTTHAVYLLPGGMTGTDRLSYPLRLIGPGHAWLLTSLCRLSDIYEQSKGLCLWYNIHSQHRCSGDLGTEVMQNFFWCVYIIFINSFIYFTIVDLMMMAKPLKAANLNKVTVGHDDTTVNLFPQKLFQLK